MKHVWMVVAIISLIGGIHKTWMYGIKESFLFFIFVLIAILMYLLRKNMDISNKNKKF